MNCPACNGKIDSSCYRNSFLIHCKHCSEIFSIKTKESNNIKVYESPNPKDINTIDKGIIIPNFELEEHVTCTDPNNPLFLEIGSVANLDHMFVRVRFKKTIIWLSHQIVERIPEEWI